MSQEALDRRRALLAHVAAEGILGHNTATELPKRLALRTLQEMLPAYGEATLLDDLGALTELGLLAKWNTGHAGYANSWIEGVDTWYVTRAGLVALWTVAP